MLLSYKGIIFIEFSQNWSFQLCEMGKTLYFSNLNDFPNIDSVEMRIKYIIVALCVVSMSCFTQIKAEKNVSYGVEAIGVLGDGDFAPYYMSSNEHGVVTQGKSALLKLDLHKHWDKSKRFSLGYGATLIGNTSSSVGYSVYDKTASAMNVREEKPSTAWIHQLYLDVKYRSVILTIGAKEAGSKMLNDRLSSGDMTLSANARPMPGMKSGFIKPQAIPFTGGWAYISGEIGYYKQTDSKWLENHYNYLNEFITTDLWFSYKYCYFHSNPSKPFSVTLGMQATCQFGGIKKEYYMGKLLSTVDMSPNVETFFRTLIPGAGGTNLGDQNYYEGNHIGSWDLMGRYRFKNGMELKAYMQSPWEDGSGIGMMNGFDGLYGVEYKSGKTSGVVTGAVVEYLDLMNQGGPLHWAPDDFLNTSITEEATGADNYYNNYAYNGYQYYGMSMGSPVLKSPIYNTDGYMAFTDTRLRSFHVGVEGSPWKNLSYRAKLSFTKSWGTIFCPISKPRDNTSAMVECVYKWHNVPGLDIKGQIAVDRGSLYGDNFGVLFSVSYSGLLKF